MTSEKESFIDVQKPVLVELNGTVLPRSIFAKHYNTHGTVHKRQNC